MSQTQVLTQNHTKLHLDLAELKTVKWLSSNYYVRRAYNLTSSQYQRLKIVTIFSWMLVPIEFFFISMWLFVHNLPWPEWFLQILYKVDGMIENILEEIARKFEWWLDVLMVRLMWFMDSVETFIDSVLSLTIFMFKKTVEFWMWSIEVVVKFVHMCLFPYIWVFRQIMPQEKIPPPIIPEITLTPDTPENRDFGISSDREIHASFDRDVRTNDLEKKTDDDELISNTSEYDSDVSVLSESWKIGHTNIAGKYYNRVEMKATAEGRLRAAMYKRVKSQLQLMRKNSVNFSRGMTFYAREIVEPRIRQVMDAIQAYILQMAKKHNLLIYYETLVKWMDSNPVLAIPFNIAFAILGIPRKFLLLVFGRKRKSKRTRSMRSESLRRKTMNMVGPVSGEPIGLGKSAEPVKEDDFCNLPKSTLKEGSDSETGARDSALASSIDDSYHTSDSGEGSLSLKEQTIAEEKEDEMSEDEKNEVRQTKEEVKYCKTKSPKSETEKVATDGQSESSNSLEKYDLENRDHLAIQIKKRRMNSPRLSLPDVKSISNESGQSKMPLSILVNWKSDSTEKLQISSSPETSPKETRKITFTV